MPIVYSYDKYSELHQTNVRQPYKATAESIMLAGGDIVPGTQEEVPEEALDGMGHFIGRAEREES
jgi:hypothetical protein